MKCPHPYEQFEFDETLSHQILIGDLKGINWNNKVIYRSSFAREIPDSKIFPDDMRGATFIYSNLDNVVIPEGNTVIDCSQKRYEVQNDLNDWLINENREPIKPINYEVFEKLGLSIPNPADIPEAPVEEPIDLLKLAQQ